MMIVVVVAVSWLYLFLGTFTTFLASSTKLDRKQDLKVEKRLEQVMICI